MARNAFFRSSRKHGIVSIEQEARYPWTEGFDDVVSLNVMGLDSREALDSLGIYPCSDEEARNESGYCNLEAGAIATRNSLSVKDAGHYIDGAIDAANALYGVSKEMQNV